MSEIICPSCSARYRIPESAIGPEGRRVHCSKCGEIWLARPVGRASPAAHDSGPQRVLPDTADAPEPVAPPSAAARHGTDETGIGSAPRMAEAPEPATQAPEPTWRRVFAAELAGDDEGQGRVASIAAAPSPDAAPGGNLMGAGSTASGALAGDAPAAGADAPTGERESQMAEIRRMLDELQTPRHAAETAAAPATASVSGFTPAGTPPAPQAAPRRPAPDPVEDTYNDPLREKLLQHDARKGGKTATPRGNYDAARLAKRHARRNRRRLVAEEQRNSSGAFLTGITLTTLVAGGMMLLYAFQAEIVEKVPGSAPAMDQYVATIDSWRGVASEKYAQAREKVEKMIEDAM